jgi:hypothetical protein
MPPTHTPLHWLNLGFHIAFGTAALGLGLVAICSSKGGRLHIRSGTLFLYSYLVVIATAVIGLLAFDFRSFFGVVTLLSFDDVFAGYRALQLRGGRPELMDQIASVVGLIAPFLFIAAMHYLHRPWSPVLTWSILGGLVTMSGYDVLRNFLPSVWLKRVWVQEHLCKMMGAYIAITSAFAGTVFARHALGGDRALGSRDRSQLRILDRRTGDMEKRQRADVGAPSPVKGGSGLVAWDFRAGESSADHSSLPVEIKDGIPSQDRWD